MRYVRSKKRVHDGKMMGFADGDLTINNDLANKTGGIHYGVSGKKHGSHGLIV